MKIKGIFGKFIVIMSALCLSIVLLWITFFSIAMSIARDNMVSLVETGSEAMISGIENELVTLSETAYSLAHYDRVQGMLSAEDSLEFYDLGGVAANRAVTVILNDCRADNVVVINNEGLYYRLLGKISNTAINRIVSLLQKGEHGYITVSTNGMDYIGAVEEVFSESKQAGFVVLLVERKRMEDYFTAFDGIEHVGIALYSDEDILCSNKEVSYEELPSLRAESDFYKEKEIGLSGLTLFVYCKDFTSHELQKFLLSAVPITMVIVLITVLIFIFYGKKTMLDPEEKALLDIQMKAKDAELSKEKTLNALLKKQISAHFTVNTLNVVRALINKDAKAEASKLCDEMSSLLRYANAGDEFISLMEEYYVLEQYVGIMQTRYPGRFSFCAEIDDAFAEIYIPRMLLQPIVENAFLHGLSDRKGTVTVETKISDFITVTVSDDGKGMTEEELISLRKDLDNPSDAEDGITKIALKNIRKRIKMSCGEKSDVYIDSKLNEGTKVTLVFDKEATKRI